MNSGQVVLHVMGLKSQGKTLVTWDQVHAPVHVYENNTVLCDLLGRLDQTPEGLLMSAESAACLEVMCSVTCEFVRECTQWR